MEAHGRVTETVGAGGTGAPEHPTSFHLSPSGAPPSPTPTSLHTETSTERQKSVPRAPGQVRHTVKQWYLASAA